MHKSASMLVESNATEISINPLNEAINGTGHVFVGAARMRPLLEARGSLDDWPAFAQSWEQLPIDGYMADGGRYRRRRHATYTVDAEGAIVLQPPQPHYQSRDYNPLHGGVERWFEPIDAELGSGASMTAILQFCRELFGSMTPAVRRWHVEVHQFRIEALQNLPGNPTPEGMHRDGVDYVLVLLIHRRNVASGVTSIHAPDGRNLGEFTLTESCDASLLDDTRVFHGVTPVQPINPTQPAYRDVLVVTFRAAPPPR